ncbi:TPM domain protein [Tepidimonas thermarum]|uniref:TPM domain protein n=1 Tax=Tepidimonas thermarum TaxID=335431 RepID=A0A554WWY4_9BURK|nr:TPM domain-containing protein [Tepidimonas thermarum]TSE28074.1 TPM domain protein [Tepidimonas thermarum]
MARIGRLWRHLWWDERASRRWLDDAAAERLRRRIEASETHHRGEIRLCVEASLPLGWLWPPPDDEAMAARVRERALAWFGRLRVWDTEDNAGVLIYVLLAERAIEIVADRGLAQRVPAQEWAAVLERLRASLRTAPPEAGLAAAVATVDGWLRRHYPALADRPNPNELPDGVVRV